MRFLVLLVLLILGSCNKYEEDTCFDMGLGIVEITKAEGGYYHFTVHSVLTLERKQTYKEFEKQIDEQGLIAKECEREEEDEK